MNRIIIVLLFSFILFSCEQEKPRVVDFDPASTQVLEEVPVDQTGFTFTNPLNEDAQVNTFTYDGLIQGSGVGVLDIDNDGLQDVYFACARTADKLFRNKGNFEFEDVSESANLSSQNLYSSCVTIVDINNDGYDDIYVGHFLYPDEEKLKNELLVNQKDGTFKDEAEKYGIADAGYTTSATFFDMDNDGDLDLYVGNQPPSATALRQQLQNKISYYFTDKLYQNNGESFSEITEAAGITNYNFTLSVSAFDYNEDGFTDLYVSCDYDEPDILYKNNGNNTFENVTDQALNHISNFSMGADMADIDNDGYQDLYVVDMVADDNFRLKTNMSGMNPKRFWALADAGYHYQYMFNAMHRNNGNGTFSDIGQLSGISATDWSWSPLFIDFDQDGLKDLYVTNGIVKELRNNDYNIWRSNHIEELKRKGQETGKIEIDALLISNKAPSVKVQNFVYRNQGDMQFERMNEEWNLTKETWSQGSAYADFDNDGDLDIVICNTNMNPLMYKNIANEQALNNYLTITLDGPSNNAKGINSKVYVYHGDTVQYSVMNPYRGYMSSSQNIVHFGLGAHGNVDKVEVIWPDGKSTIMENVDANQTISISAENRTERSGKKMMAKMVKELPQDETIIYEENEFNDYDREILLPHKLSTLGPFVAKADINNDGNDDFYLGGSAGTPGKMYLGSMKGTFSLLKVPVFLQDKDYEDGGALFFDADGDNDLDLYVSSGGNEFEEGSAMYQDRLYINNDGAFVKSNQLPDSKISTGSIASDDFDGDGDNDLFVGGRQVPGRYGFTPQSHFLQNDSGSFSISQSLDAGMVTGASFEDINGDDKKELILCGEWSPITIMERKDNEWTNASSDYGLNNTEGWWNTLKVSDIDNDGDADLLVGNLGLNIKYKASAEKPFTLFVDDFDNNSTNDVYLGYYGKDGKCYPVRGRECSSQQMPFIKKEFKTYNDFGVATIEDVLEGKLDDESVKQKVVEFRNGYFENDGNGQFTFRPFSNYGQTSPIFSYAFHDVNNDGIKDIIAAGNYYNREVETTRSDAGTGFIGFVNENGDVDIQMTLKTGFYADEDVRGIEIFKAGDSYIVGVFNNNTNSQFYEIL